MAVQLQLRRGTAAENADFIGAQGELTYATDTKALRIHDGETVGGFAVDVVVGWQAPTAENNYTWYRKYASGWVEQGGGVTSVTSENPKTITLPVQMSDTNYCITYGDSNIGQKNPLTQSRIVKTYSKSTTQFQTTGVYDNLSGSDYCFDWQVKGMAA